MINANDQIGAVHSDQVGAWGALAQFRLEEIAKCSLPGSGVTRLPFTNEHRAAVEVMTGWLHAAGMDTSLDGAGTLIGRRNASGARAGRTFIMASHQDSVRNGGRYDGIMGVALACLAVEKLNAAGYQPDFAIEVQAFADEEGVRFPTALIGPRAQAGTIDLKVLDMQDVDDIAVRDALRGFGADPNAIAALARDPNSVLGYLEAHIEQGPVLEAENLSVGVVTSICGIERNTITFNGKTGHAGTVPMQGRRDALVAAAAFIGKATAAAKKQDDMRVTFGTLSLLPGAVNQIPETVSLSMEIRCPNDTRRSTFSAHARELAEDISHQSGCDVSLQQTYFQQAQDCHSPFMQKLSDAAEAVQGRSFCLPSGATHDASAMASLCPIAMLFVRCRNGVSHVPEEFASEQDMGAAIDVMARFLQTL